MGGQSLKARRPNPSLGPQAEQGCHCSTRDQRERTRRTWRIWRARRTRRAGAWRWWTSSSIAAPTSARGIERTSVKLAPQRQEVSDLRQSRRHERMNSSKPYGPLGRSTDFGGRGSTVRTANVAFPLTPTLSLGERENSPLSFSKTQRDFCSTNSRAT